MFVFCLCLGGLGRLIGGKTLIVGAVGLLLGGSLCIVFVMCGIVGMGPDELSSLCRGCQGRFEYVLEVGMCGRVIRGVWCLCWWQWWGGMCCGVCAV